MTTYRACSDAEVVVGLPEFYEVRGNVDEKIKPLRHDLYSQGFQCLLQLPQTEAADLHVRCAENSHG